MELAINTYDYHQDSGNGVEDLRKTQGIFLSEPNRHGVKVLRAVKFFILQSVDDVKTTNPAQYYQRK